LSDVAVFDPSEILTFQAVDFLGTCTGVCEFAPPFIVFTAVDALTGLEISVSHGELDHFMELLLQTGASLKIKHSGVAVAPCRNLARLGCLL
jgi:hypothetical protein